MIKVTALALTALLALTACGEQQSASKTGAPVGLMSAPASDVAHNENESDSKTTKKKSNKQENVPFTGTPVDINTASAAELVAVLKGTGVGKAKVENIIAYREEHGGFKSVEELNAVKGIGDKTMEKIRPRLTVSKAVK